MAEPEKYLRKNSFVLTALELINSSGGHVPLNDYLLEFRIKEDLFSNFMSGSLSISDVNNLAGVFPLIGNEMVLAVFKTPRFSNREIKVAFACVKIAEKTILSPSKMQAYELTLVSNPYIRGTNKKISKTYKGKISEIVKSILDETMEVDVATSISDTEGKFKFTFPFMSPYTAISMASKKAYFKRKDFTDTNFLFYETIDGLNFKSLYEIKNQDPITEINYYPTNAGQGSGFDENRFNSGELLEVSKHFNRLSEMYTGTYASAITKYDLTFKTIKSNIVSLEDVEVQSNMLNKYTTTPEEIAYLRQGFTVNHVVPNQSYAYSASSELNTEEDIEDNSKSFETTAHRIIDFMRSNGNKITIRVAGNSDLSVGQTIYFDCPRQQVKLENQSENTDPILSGKYIISKIDHVLTKQDYYCNMELIKDSVIQPLISAS